ncbi:glutathione gamma-glutamylcysteinyltransferase 2-like isoform X3 [Abrus precatorius]|uniref:glutathione gamma-glutamylcysteinyltransferase n=1 Tax=Abrus precatorius TaxID=3816 RepID=A0A8B8LAY5_ABRPR|nr:glutathione gamma-glutamylcysteinyltransferase 2-like isoform X3 [Abrus precatorius]
MASPGLYRRALPSPPAVDFASPEGKKIFVEALGQGTMEGFFKLISNYKTQSEPAYCALATLSVVLNALAIDPGRKWKGPWRWFDDSMLDCCEPLEKIKAEGLTFGKLACLARCNGAKVEAFRANGSSVHDFRNRVIACCSSEDCHVIVSYHRAPLNQTGIGHFSPIGGYHAERDMVLVLDVARFKYPPHWVPLNLLWDAVSTIDQATGLYRGYMIISKLNRAPSVLYTVADILEQIRTTALFKHVTRWLDSESTCCNTFVKLSDKEMLPALAADVCCQGADLLTGCGRLALSSGKCCSQIDVKQLNVDTENPVTIASGTVATGGGSVQEVDVLVPLCQRVPSRFCLSNEGHCIGMHPSTADVLTVLLLALPLHTWSGIKEEKLQVEVTSLLITEDLPPLLQEEVSFLREQLHFLMTDIGDPSH